MITTEKEASTKWCPQTIRKMVSDGRGKFVPEVGAKCIGSGCMAWRLINTWDAQVAGYCGLAGKP